MRLYTGGRECHICCLLMDSCPFIASGSSWFLLLIVAGVIWNLAITFGLLGILDGHMSGHEMLEMPTEVWPAMLISYLIITFLALVIHRSRQIKETIAPQWFILAALLWFPALFLIAWHGLEINTARGTLQTVLFDVVWAKPYLALANSGGIGCCLLPYNVLGRTIYKYYLAIFVLRVLLHLLHGRLCIIYRSSSMDSSNWYGYEYCNGFPNCSCIN